MKNAARYCILYLILPPTESGWYWFIVYIQNNSESIWCVGLSILGAMASTARKIYDEGPIGITRGFLFFFVSVVIGASCSKLALWILRIPDEFQYIIAVLSGFGGFELSDIVKKWIKNFKQARKDLQVLDSDNNKKTES